MRSVAAEIAGLLAEEVAYPFRRGGRWLQHWAVRSWLLTQLAVLKAAIWLFRGGVDPKKRGW